MFFAGIDVGGTAIKAGLVDEHGALSRPREVRTPYNSLKELVETLADLISGYQQSAAIAGAGIGVAGLRSTRTGVIETSPNIPCLQGANLERELKNRLGIAVVSENDANAGAYGEWSTGAGQGLQHIVYITIGTGLGCGLILSGTLYRGASGYAGELGHTLIESDGGVCPCGKVGCLETRVSATGIVRTAQKMGLQGPLTSKSIYELAVAGDRLARATFEDTGRFLGQACANMINLLNPEMIILGGGVMAAGDWILEPARKEAARSSFAPSLRDCQIVQSSLGPESGTIGAAMLARDNS